MARLKDTHRKVKEIKLVLDDDYIKTYFELDEIILAMRGCHNAIGALKKLIVNYDLKREEELNFK